MMIVAHGSFLANKNAPRLQNLIVGTLRGQHLLRAQVALGLLLVVPVADLVAPRQFGPCWPFEARCRGGNLMLRCSSDNACRVLARVLTLLLGRENAAPLRLSTCLAKLTPSTENNFPFDLRRSRYALRRAFMVSGK